MLAIPSGSSLQLPHAEWWPASTRRANARTVSPDRNQELLIALPMGVHKWEDYILDTQALLFHGAKANVRAIENLTSGVGELGYSIEQHLAASAVQQAELLHLFQEFIAAAGASWEKVSEQLDTLTEVTKVVGLMYLIVTFSKSRHS